MNGEINDVNSKFLININNIFYLLFMKWVIK